jgi:photosynthetic reaction center cytochrome c subunit
MKQNSWTVSCAAALIACCGAPGARAQSAPAPSKVAEEAFKNIQVLKGTPADQLIPAMQFISASLGVECEFCHVEAKFDADDKKPKLTARKMITMTLAINKENFDGRREVTCNSCHRGETHPMGAPAVLGEDAKPARPEIPSIDAGKIIDNYVAAIGGADAIRKISSREEKGKITAGGHESDIDLFMKAPDKRMSVMHAPNGDSITAFDGKGGWLGNGGRPPRDMSGTEAEAARLDADFYFATRVKEIFSQLRVTRAETIGGREAYAVVGIRQGMPPVRLYFDETSGLLVRMVRYSDTPLGRMPTQIDYADYRDADGVKIPFRWTLSRPNGRFTIQVDKVQQNVPIDDSKFAKP